MSSIQQTNVAAIEEKIPVQESVILAPAPTQEAELDNSDDSDEETEQSPSSTANQQDKRKPEISEGDRTASQFPVLTPKEKFIGLILPFSELFEDSATSEEIREYCAKFVSDVKENAFDFTQVFSFEYGSDPSKNSDEENFLTFVHNDLTTEILPKLKKFKKVEENNTVTAACWILEEAILAISNQLKKIQRMTAESKCKNEMAQIAEKAEQEKQIIADIKKITRQETDKILATFASNHVLFANFKLENLEALERIFKIEREFAELKSRLESSQNCAAVPSAISMYRMRNMEDDLREAKETALKNKNRLAKNMAHQGILASARILDDQINKICSHRQDFSKACNDLIEASGLNYQDPRVMAFRKAESQDRIGIEVAKTVVKDEIGALVMSLNY